MKQEEQPSLCKWAEEQARMLWPGLIEHCESDFVYSEEIYRTIEERGIP